MPGHNKPEVHYCLQSPTVSIVILLGVCECLVVSPGRVMAKASSNVCAWGSK